MKIFRVRQSFDAPRVDDVSAEVHVQLARLDLAAKIQPGQSVAVTAGSRGIANIHLIVRSIVEHLKSLGAAPLVVTAMGSHGGGTARGQRKLIESYGVTEQFVGCPIRAGMETVIIGRTAEGVPIHFDRCAFQADHVLICGRVKPHTRFAGRFESGLMKMMLVGLGNRRGAEACHEAAELCGFDRFVDSAADMVLEKCRIVAGLAIVENAYDQTALIEAVASEQFKPREQELLVLAKRWMPRLPFRHVDVLLIDRIGKDISGTGFDPNVVGRKFDDHKAVEGEFPKVERIALRGLTAQTHGNAVGLGMAEFCRSRLLEQTDLEATRLNATTARHASAAVTPPHYRTDREMLQAALDSIQLSTVQRMKMLWIADTLHLGEVECSVAYLDEAGRRDDLEIITKPRELPFDAPGNLPDFAEV